MIKIEQKGELSKTIGFLSKAHDHIMNRRLDKFARKGVRALQEATPKDSGITAESWNYEIKTNNEETTITWTNDSLASNNVPIVILLRYGHATANGRYVQGNDFITPAIKPIFDEIAAASWKEVTK